MFSLTYTHACSRWGSLGSRMMTGHPPAVQHVAEIDGQQPLNVTSVEDDTNSSSKNAAAQYHHGPRLVGLGGLERRHCSFMAKAQKFSIVVERGIGCCELSGQSGKKHEQIRVRFQWLASSTTLITSRHLPCSCTARSFIAVSSSILSASGIELLSARLRSLRPNRDFTLVEFRSQNQPCMKLPNSLAFVSACTVRRTQLTSCFFRVH